MMGSYKKKLALLFFAVLAQQSFAQLPTWGDYPRVSGQAGLTARADDYAQYSQLSQPAIRDWQRQQTLLTQKVLARLTETEEFKLAFKSQTPQNAPTVQALSWQQQHFYSEMAQDGKCRLIVRQLPVGNERTLYVCEARQSLLGFRLAADASMLAVLLQESGATSNDKPQHVIRLIQSDGQKLLPERIPTASQVAQEIMVLPKAAGLLYRPVSLPGARKAPALLFWHGSGQANSEDKPAFPQQQIPARLELKNAKASTKLSLSWYAPAQLYPQIWIVDLEKFDATKPRFNWQRRFSSSQQVRDVSFDEQGLYWISASSDWRGALWQQAWQAGAAAKRLNLPGKPALWQVHASDGKLWLHHIEQAQSKLLKYDLSKQQALSLDLPVSGRLSQLAGELPGFMLESNRQAAQAYQLNAQDNLRNWDIARPYLAPLAISEQIHKLPDFPNLQLRLLHKSGLELDAKRPLILMAEKLDQLQQLPRFNAQWYAWLERDGILAWLQNSDLAPPSKKLAKNIKSKEQPEFCQALLSASDFLRREGYTQAASLYLWERAPAPACWWWLLQQAPERFAAIASDQLPKNAAGPEQLKSNSKYPAMLLSLDSKTEVQTQLAFMPVLAKLQQTNPMVARPILYRSDILGNWLASQSNPQAEDWGFFWWRYRQEVIQTKP